MLLGAAIAAATIYLAFLFWLAARRDREGPGRLSRHAGLIYGLSLAVYCTSWTFFGGVGTAASGGLEFFPIYLGPILLFTFGYGLVRRVLAQGKAQHSTSIADFLSARYGKSASVAALVTIIATIGSLPYMALQLRSVGNSLGMLGPSLMAGVALDELVLMVCGVMALFAILFGSRRADGESENSGLVLTIALESVVKLVALLAVAALATALLLAPAAPPTPQICTSSQIDARFAALTLVAGCAALCLPRQFHMTIVASPDARATPAMRWVFPVYLVVISAVIVPIVMAGLAVLPPETDPDTIVMALPLASGNEALALIVFIGGFSASAGMIVVASVALSTMITNDLIAPLVFRRALSGAGDRGQIAGALLTIRRGVIAALMFFAYLFYLGFGALSDLAGLGILAFAAAAQFAPGIVLGITSRAGNKAGMLAGLLVGFALWLSLLIVPASTGAAPFLSIHPDPLVSGVVLSLSANCLAYWIGSAMWQPSLVDAAQAAAFVGTPGGGGGPRFATTRRVADLRLLLAQFVGHDRASAAIAAMPRPYGDRDMADDDIVAMAERTISGVIGSSSSRMLVSSWADGDPVPFAEVVAMFDETNRRLSFSGELLQIAIENIDQGVALVDAEMHLVAWNSRYHDMFDLPDSLVAVGTPIADLIRFNLRQSRIAEDEVERQIARRLDHMRAGRRHRIEREQHDGRIMRIVGSPTPGGGYVTSYTDITADRRAEQALEEKVAERTEQLSEMNVALEAATRSKTRFLAAASHDLIQPLNAARLFASALGEEVGQDAQLSRPVRDLDGSIASADRLIRALLDISKLDGGGIEPKLEPVAIDRVFDELVREFAVQARAKGLQLRQVRTSAWVMSDRALLGSVLRNLVSNAIRYTDEGAVLLGVRRFEKGVRISVTDSGRGIAEGDLGRIFDEFQRAGSTDREGLGLGLAIVRRIARVLDVEVRTRSRPGAGSMFEIELPVLRWDRTRQVLPSEPSGNRLASARILIVDNDPAVLRATSALIEKWGLIPLRATSLVEALSREAPEVVVMDYRLDGDERGDLAYEKLCKHWNARPPAILLTAEAGEETERAAWAMGANRLLKPPSPAALRALLSTSLARREAEPADQLDAEAATG